ncbi:MAG: hypothetical protein GQF41_1026 [Candidatus Rifleibacterium amylolyticum]|nr:MAG: hypothetical protein GQF41_1026 [Candidatus Rifleibacterium amylolyticum]
MSHTCLSSVAIDLGAINTGIYLFQMVDGELSSADKKGVLIRLDPDKIKLSQVTRRARRHQRRCYARRKLAKRLLKIILEHKFNAPYDKLPNNTVEFINGLMNRRGYTFLGFDELDVDEINILDNNMLGEWLPDFFAGSTVAATEQLQMITSDLQQCEKLGKSLEQLLKTAKDKTGILGSLDKEIKKPVLSALNKMHEAISSTLKSERDGHYHRREYFENIHNDIHDFSDVLKPFYQLSKLNSEALFRLVGHISNLQLRVLRKYFNDEKMKNCSDYWCDTRFKKYFQRYVRAWHARKDAKIAENRRNIIASLAENDVIDFWLGHHPELTIPPFEDQNNRRPPVCHSLIFDQGKLDQYYRHWRQVTAELIKLVDKDYAVTDANAHIALQRILDQSSALDYYSIRGLVENRNESRLKSEVYDARRQELQQKVGNNAAEEFLGLAKQYFYESSLAASGDWHEEIDTGLLKKCGKHPPRKEKQLDKILSSILRIDMDSAMLDSFRSFFSNHKYKGNSTCRSVAEKAAKAQKEYGASLKAILEQGNNSELNKLMEQITLAASALESFLENNMSANGKKHEYQGKLADLFIFAQMYNLLYQDIQGFSSNCRNCTLENAWRSLRSEADNSIANGRRLPADSVRPFDGVLARSVELIASAAARAKASQLLQLPEYISEVDITTGIETNSFEFSSELSEVKKKQLGKRADSKLEALAIQQIEFNQAKFDRIKSDSCGICPYTGEKLTGFGHIDHIIPRSYTRDRFRAVFNSEANLIYCSVAGNNRKGDREYTLDDLNDNYLKAVFNSADREWITGHISEEVSRLLNANTRITSLNSLTFDQRKCIRHAMFIPALRNELLSELNQQNRVRVNGTQKYFLSVLRRKIESAIKAKRPQLALNFRSERVASSVIAAYRNALSQFAPENAKKMPQPAFSHIIDAAMLFAAQSAVGFKNPTNNLAPAEDPAYLKQLLPEEFEITSLNKRPVYRANAWHQPLFKDTIYGAHFLPFIITGEGRSGFGYDQQNCVYINKDEDKVFAAIRPFLRKPSPELNEIKKQAINSKDSIVLTFNKSRIFELLHKVAKYEASESMNYQADLFEAILYQSQKTSLQSAMFDQSGKKMLTREEILKDNRFVTKIELPARLGSNKDFVLPFKFAWLKLLEQDFIKTCFGRKLDNEDLAKLDQKIRTYFLEKTKHNKTSQRMAQRKHARARRVFSLPVKPGAAGAVFAIKRKTPAGQIWQLMASEQAYEGFRTDRSSFGAEAKMLLAQLSASKNAFALGARYSARTANVSVDYMDSWKKIPLNGELATKLISLELCPGQATRRYARITVHDNLFMQAIYPCLAIDNDSERHSLLLLPEYKFAKDKKENFKKELPGLGCPRTFVRIEKAGKEVTFTYEADGVSSAIAGRYFSV